MHDLMKDVSKQKNLLRTTTLDLDKYVAKFSQAEQTVLKLNDTIQSKEAYN